MKGVHLTGSIRRSGPGLALHGDVNEDLAPVLLETEGRLGQGRFQAADLSIFRTYLARLSAGYGGFRGGENDSSLGNRPCFPYGAGLPPSRF